MKAKIEEEKTRRTRDDKNSAKEKGRAENREGQKRKLRRKRKKRNNTTMRSTRIRTHAVFPDAVLLKNEVPEKEDCSKKTSNKGCDGWNGV